MSLPALVRRVKTRRNVREWVGRSASEVAYRMLECDALYLWRGVDVPPEPCRVVRVSGDRALVEFPGRYGDLRSELVVWVNRGDVACLSR